MSTCHDIKEDPKIFEQKNKVLLMGNPNVGKSVFFSNMTGVNVVSSNFAGTTVSYTAGKMKMGETEYSLIDVPGIYAAEATSEAEAVAIKFMNADPLAILFVIDASNLERNIKLALELKNFNIPTVYALNLMDVAGRKGIDIDIDLLAEELGGPVIPTVAVKNEGFDQMMKTLEETIATAEPAVKGCPTCPKCGPIDPEVWDKARVITEKVRKHTAAKPSFLDKLGDAMLRPWPGVPIALLVIILALGAVVGGGKALRATLLLPLVNKILVPFFANLFSSFIPEGMILNVLIGEYGVFVIGFEWIIALILPYVTLFYVVFSFLEDSGILPRLSVLFDNIMRKIGLQGGSMITLSMGYGCAIPAIIGSRVATTYKERLITSTVVCFAIPCISQTGALISLFAGFNPILLIMMFGLSILVLMTVSAILGKTLKGTVDPMVIEVPHLLLPNGKAYSRKLMIRMKEFLVEAEGPMLLAVLLAALLKETGLLDYIAVFFEPVVSGWLGLPKEAAIALILGIVRREMAVAPLLAIPGLTALQAFVGGTVALLYLPCLSVFGILAKEFNAKVAVAIGLTTTVTAIVVAGVINQVAHLFM